MLVTREVHLSLSRTGLGLGLVDHKSLKVCSKSRNKMVKLNERSQTQLILHAYQHHNVGIFSVFLAVAVTEVILYILLHADM